MIIPDYKYQGYRLKNAMLNAKDFNSNDIILYKVFLNALKKMPNDLDETLFYEYMECLSHDLVDILCYYILVSQIGSKIFTKNIYYISELCTALTITDTSPLKYAEYANFFLSEPIYSLIIKINKVSYVFGYLTLIDRIIRLFDLSDINEKSYNEITKTLYKILEEKHYTLFNNCHTLEDIYIKLHQAMFNSNKNGYIFTRNDFEALHCLKCYIESNDPELTAILKEKLLSVEDSSFDNLSIIRNCLKEITDYQKKIIPINLYRRKAYEKK